MGRTLSVWMGIALLCQALLASGLGLLIDISSPFIGFVSMGGLMISLGIQVFVWRKSHKEKTKIDYEVV